MNYSKIYDDLIEHRKMLPKIDGQYYERHHIIPRCLGGTDEDENLVFLTAEDHFVAHLLLAKVYGGVLWFAAAAVSMAKSGRKIKNRRSFSTVRENACNLQRDNEMREYRVVLTGEVFKSTRKDLCEKFGMHRVEAYRLHADVARSAKGVELASNTPATVYEFVCNKTGSIYKMNQYMLCEVLGLNFPDVTSLLKGATKSVKGISLLEPVASKAVKEGQGQRHYLLNTTTGEVIYVNSSYMEYTHGMLRASYSALITNKTRISKGFRLATEKEANACQALI